MNKRIVLEQLAEAVQAFIEASEDGRDVPAWVKEYVDEFKEFTSKLG